MNFSSYPGPLILAHQQVLSFLLSKFVSRIHPQFFIFTAVILSCLWGPKHSLLNEESATKGMLLGYVGQDYDFVLFFCHGLKIVHDILGSQLSFQILVAMNSSRQFRIQRWKDMAAAFHELQV